MSDGASISTNVGTTLLFENERVRVWDLRIEPGQSTGLHCHRADYLYVVIGDGVLQRRDADGTEHSPVEMSDGTVRFRALDSEDVHEAINVGATPWRNIVVELKEQPPGPNDP